MTGLERQLTEALERLSGQYEKEQRWHSEQLEALRRQSERQAGRSKTLRRLVEQLSGQVKRLAEDSGIGSRTTPLDGRWR